MKSWSNYRLSPSHTFPLLWNQLIDQSIASAGLVDACQKLSYEGELSASGFPDFNTNTCDPGFFVLRDMSLLTLFVDRVLQGITKVSVRQLVDFHPSLLRALVPVQVECSGPGHPETNSYLYTAISADDPKSPTLEHTCTIGFVQYAGYSQALGHGIGIGFAGTAWFK
ncbi:unnamed protein product, partial [Protopolystoma xenopodis]